VSEPPILEARIIIKALEDAFCRKCDYAYWNEDNKIECDQSRKECLVKGVFFDLSEDDPVG
jgi:hypothetical protein